MPRPSHWGSASAIRRSHSLRDHWAPVRCRRGSGPPPTKDPSPKNPQPDYRTEVSRSGSTTEDRRGYEDNRRRVRHQALRP